MTRILTLFVALVAGFLPLAAKAQMAYPERTIGEARAPIVIDEYISLTCPHCAQFYTGTLPELEKRYVKTGKVRIVMHDYPLDGLALKAAAVGRCMPPDEVFTYIRTLYENQQKWIPAANPEKIIIQYAVINGLDEDRAKVCINDPNIQNMIVADRAAATDAYGIQSTPTFVFNKGVEKIEGDADIGTFAATIDRMLAHVK